MHFGNQSVDLVVAGPNEGGNAGPFLYMLSGTMGATYISVYRGVRLTIKRRTHSPDLIIL